MVKPTQLSEVLRYKFKSNGEEVLDIYKKHSDGLTYYLAVGVKGKEERFTPGLTHKYLEEYGVKTDPVMNFESGDILINKEPHSCEAKFVEGQSEEGIWLVGGSGDEFYNPSEYKLLMQKYVLLCKKENREDL